MKSCRPFIRIQIQLILENHKNSRRQVCAFDKQTRKETTLFSDVDTRPVVLDGRNRIIRPDMAKENSRNVLEQEKSVRRPYELTAPQDLRNKRHFAYPDHGPMDEAVESTPSKMKRTTENGNRVQPSQPNTTHEPIVPMFPSFPETKEELDREVQSSLHRFERDFGSLSP